MSKLQIDWIYIYGRFLKQRYPKSSILLGFTHSITASFSGAKSRCCIASAAPQTIPHCFGEYIQVYSMCSIARHIPQRLEIYTYTSRGSYQ